MSKAIRDYGTTDKPANPASNENIMPDFFCTSTYLLLAIALLLLLANSYTSVIVLRSVVSERKQKLMQLAFIWLLPFAGAFLAINILKEKTRSYLFQPPSFGWSTVGENGGVGAEYADGYLPVID